MESIDLYEDPLSLFDRDLGHVEFTLAEDGLKTLPSIEKEQTRAFSEDQDLMFLNNQDIMDPLSTDWMDTKVDLLELLAGDSFDLSMVETDVPMENTETKKDTGLEVLQKVSEEVTKQLKTSSDGDVNTTESPVTATTVLDMLSEGIDIHDLDFQSLPQIDSAAFSKVTPEDVESILSSEPPSPSSTKASSVVTSDTESNDMWEPPSCSKSAKSRSRAKPYEKPKVKTEEKKQRKMAQNKAAATRYRQKKRQEAELVNNECDELEGKNKTLKDKVEQMTNEIQYLKNLLTEVYKAKGMTPPI